jgi:hypothetical protein
MDMVRPFVPLKQLSRRVVSNLLLGSIGCHGIIMVRQVGQN